MRRALFALLLCCASAQANAHAVIAAHEPPADSYFKVVIAIAHGCEGSPTKAMRVRIPDGILTARPQPKPGWALETKKQKLEKPVAGPHGSSVSEIVTEVTWTGKLEAEHFDEFVIQVRLPDRPAETLYFATVQECERGVHRWIEIPAPGQSSRDLAQPAPSVKIAPKARARHRH
jgi:uncharacterized protein YcnI